jgi:uncharacterized alpha-E superfamily protein
VPRAAAELPSRVADNLYWLGRYVERLEDTLRVLRYVIGRMAYEAAAESAPELAVLMQVLARLEMLPKRFLGRVPLKELEQEILSLVYDPQHVGSVRELGLRIRHIMSVVRDRFSGDTWRILNQLQTDSRTRPGRIPLANALSLLNTLIVDLAAFSGMEMENMTRGHGWRFLDFGRRLERGANLIKLLRGGLSAEAKSPAVLEPLLEIADSSMTYRRRYLAQAQLPSLLDLLIADVGNPRSLAFQLNALTEHAANLPRYEKASAANGEEERLAEMTELLENGDIGELARLYAQGQVEPLHDWLNAFGAGLIALSDDLTHHYFSLTVARVS